MTPEEEMRRLEVEAERRAEMREWLLAPPDHEPLFQRMFELGRRHGEEHARRIIDAILNGEKQA